MYYDKIQVNYFMTRKNPQSLFYSLLLRPHSDICITTHKKKITIKRCVFCFNFLNGSQVGACYY